ncbi:UMF1 family MFS transporter [Lewinella marina]|uniref:MFS transporter n=1 Tax=Neolewinella marina TaxID=438751 RepID=A0A2G0CFB0_9BACT|nr:MFS transporter [Neolewinella marina]NJB85713.1 UMF1 family MFS transporter [Neolewinella marina]PHK98610.1 MFS transporter [Neolewinella marina]
MSHPLNDPKTLQGWALFDWANSAFALVITTAIFPPYFEEMVDEQFRVLGLEFTNSSWFAYLITFSYLVIAAFSPFLSGIADAGGRRKSFLRTFTIMGGLGCLSLFFFTGMDTLWIGSLGFIVGLIGFAGGLVFYNSFLPVIATEDRFDRLSARGFAMGYVGSVILLVVNLAMVTQPGWFGLPETGTLAVRMAFLTVGVWWLVFAAVSLSRLPNDEPRPGTGLGEMAAMGWQELRKVWNQLEEHPQAKRFLAAFFSYSAGVQTIIFLASIFAKKELNFATQELIVVVLILQIVAIGGAYLAARISELRGNKFALYVELTIWILICVLAYFVSGKVQFYLIAGAVGLVMGGIQSLSRSTYAKVIPAETNGGVRRTDTTSWFSFYDVLEKVAIVLGTFIFGFLDALTGSMRLSILILALFFLVGMLLLSRFTLTPRRVQT